MGASADFNAGPTIDAELAELAETFDAAPQRGARGPHNGENGPRLSLSLGPPNADLRLVQPRAPASRTLARLRELLFVEGESAGSTAGGDDEDLVAGGFGRTQRVTQIVLDVTALQAKLPRKPRHRPRLVGQQRQQIRSKHQRILQRAQAFEVLGGRRRNHLTSSSRVTGVQDQAHRSGNHLHENIGYGAFHGIPSPC